MHTFVLQEWTTIRGTTGTYGQTIVQSERDWLDLSPFQDLFAWVDVREVTGAGVNLFFETSPTEDDNFFISMLGAGTAAISNVAPTTTPTVIKLPMLVAAVPLARYLRWKLTGPASTWDLTMRIVVAANSPGM